MTYFKRLTPKMRKDIIGALDGVIEELKTHDPDDYQADILIYSYESCKRLIRDLPDGSLIPFNKD